MSARGDLTERVATLEADTKNIAKSLDDFKETIGKDISGLRREFRTARNAGFWLLVMLCLTFGGTALALMFNYQGG